MASLAVDAVNPTSSNEAESFSLASGNRRKRAPKTFEFVTGKGSDLCRIFSLSVIFEIYDMN